MWTTAVNSCPQYGEKLLKESDECYEILADNTTIITKKNQFNMQKSVHIFTMWTE